MKKSLHISVLGGGSFGTTLCNLIAENGFYANLWVRNEERAFEINNHHVNSNYLPDLKLDHRVTASTDLISCVSKADILFIAVPSQSFENVLSNISDYVPETTYIISLTKGIDHNNFKLMSQLINEYFPINEVGVLSVPNLAKELSQKQLTATVIASTSPILIKSIQEVLYSPFFRVYSSEDIFGVELGGALKNIYAIISGLASALDVGMNTHAMIMTRSLAEMSRFAVSMGANPLTFLGLSGVGDLIVTCSSSLSRNYQVGYSIGKGKNIDEATVELGQVAEGVNTLKLVVNKARELDVYMPLAFGLHSLIYENQTIDNIIKQLMSGDQSTDVEFTIKSDNS